MTKYGNGYSCLISSKLEIETRGVVIDTLLPRRIDKVVAALPMEMLPISPIASFSIGVNSGRGGAAAESPRSNASISSCDRNPSFILFISSRNDLSYLDSEFVARQTWLAFEFFVAANNDA